MAALTAATHGCRTLLLEKSSKFGGMTAYSGAGIWIPANHHARAAGIRDSPAEALEYIRATAPPDWAQSEDSLWMAFVENAPEALLEIERHTPLKFSLVSGPDVFLNEPGAKMHGRMVSPELLSTFSIGSLRHKLRVSVLPQLMTYREAQQYDPLTLRGRKALAWAPKLVWRLICGYRGMGAALVIGLLSGLQRVGVSIIEDAASIDLLFEDERVAGVTCHLNGAAQTFRATRGVVMATGGFEWDTKMRETFFPGPVDYLTSPRSNCGDAVRMASRVGAALAHMDQANLNAAIPGRYEGRIQGIGWFLHHFAGAIVVDAAGERFGNEIDPNFFMLLNSRTMSGSLKHCPAWLISDAHLFEEHRLARLIASPHRDWIQSAPTLYELATKIALPSSTLVKTVEQFNEDGVRGSDRMFGRTKLRTINKAPFIAVPFNRSFMSTKGGPRTDEHARVLRPDGSIIHGLYCAGVAMANPIGTKAISAGTTLGPNLTWGYIAGKSIAKHRSVSEIKV